MKFLPLILTLLGVATSIPASPLDTVVFGDTTSESSHGLVAVASGTTTGALAQPARFLQPILNAGSYGVNGGDLTFAMTVDPVRRNYFTVKLWGGDDNGEDLGRLYLYVPIDGVNYQVGYRHEGDSLPLSAGAWNPPCREPPRGMTRVIQGFLQPGPGKRCPLWTGLWPGQKIEVKDLHRITILRIEGHGLGILLMGLHENGGGSKALLDGLQRTNHRRRDTLATMGMGCGKIVKKHLPRS